MPGIAARHFLARVTNMARYTVTGRTRFPIDMLRYDCSWPNSSESASKIAGTFGSHGVGEVTIGLSSDKKPTPARWASFGWRVST
jgi:hypothetical protein